MTMRKTGKGRTKAPIGGSMSTDLPPMIEFNRPKKYRVLRILGTGACGQTVLLRDDEMECDFVAKKYKPVVSKTTDKAFFDELLERFRHEARILFRLNHPNIVRVFNFYDYEEYDTAFILMEWISGENISEYIARNPDKIDAVFEKTITGFLHLETKNILHRDIRPMNILVTDDGEPKIIDFGFGKVLEFGVSSGDRSITLNWWCEPPPEIAQSKYDFQTEVYFVGKLFEQAVVEGNLSEFKHRDVLRDMCKPDRRSRLRSFAEVQGRLGGAQFKTLKFSEDKIQNYRDFATALTDLITKIGSDSSYREDVSAIVTSLENILNQNILEEFVSEPVSLGRAFIKGAFWFRKNHTIPVEVVDRFVGMIRSLSAEKKAIVMRNLQSRLNSIPRHDPPSPLEDEIPF